MPTLFQGQWWKRDLTQDEKDYLEDAELRRWHDTDRVNEMWYDSDDGSSFHSGWGFDYTHKE